jgi:hypothetical protein
MYEECIRKVAGDGIETFVEESSNKVPHVQSGRSKLNLAGGTK